MSTLTRAESARINGAKFRGPKTIEGKARSSRNALTHGMTCAPRVTLVNESDPDFMPVYHAYKEIYKPKDQEELDFLDAMVSYRWRWFRASGFEAEYVSENLREIHKELENAAPGAALVLPAGRTFVAFHRACETSKFLPISPFMKDASAAASSSPALNSAV